MAITLPIKRQFRWRVFVTLVILYFVGNLAGIPLLRKTNAPVEPIWFWGVATTIASLVIALSLILANHTSLGAPLLEGRLTKEELPRWLKTGLALTVLMLLVGFPLSLFANLGAESDTYPFGWELFPASFKAGIVEEIANRLFLVSLFVWIGKFFKQDEEGRPANAIYWAGIVLAGLIFGWAHVDARLSNPTVPVWGFVLIMALGSMLGIYFGWLFWKLGLEWAMIAHFVYDVFISILVIPVYLSGSLIAWGMLILGLVMASGLSWRYLIQDSTGREA